MVIDLLSKSEEYFIQVQGEADWSDGWKISIQGHNLDDTLYLMERLVILTQATKCSFKLGTQKLIDLNNEQSTKLFTIYIPNGVDPVSFAELVRLNIPDYTGAHDILEKKSYTRYAAGIFYRNDRTEAGVYIPA